MALAVLVALVLAGCGGGDGPAAAPAGPPGDTRAATWVDRDGDGVLERGPGRPLRTRTDLGGSPTPRGPRLARFAQLTDTHVRDEESPARAPFLDRLGSPLQDVFRPHEALTAQALGAISTSINAAGPDAVLLTGDIADSAQRNELELALDVLQGRTARPDSGAPGYDGVQEAENPDPGFYRPDVDPPAKPGLLDRAQRPFDAPGLDAPLKPLLGNHDVLVGGELPPSDRTRALATGSLAVVEPPPGLEVPRDSAGLSPDLLDDLLGQGVAQSGAEVRAVPADADRTHLTADGVARRLRRAAGLPAADPGQRLEYAFDLGDRVRVIVLDTVRRDLTAKGRADAQTLAVLRRELARAGDRWVVVASHEPLDRTEGAEPVLAALDRHPRTLAAFAGSAHEAEVAPRRAPNGGWWLVRTPSLADFPMQARAVEVRETADGGALLDTWLLDMAPGELPDTARELAFLDAQGGRPRGLPGAREDGNVRLVRPAPRSGDR